MWNIFANSVVRCFEGNPTKPYFSLIFIPMNNIGPYFKTLNTINLFKSFKEYNKKKFLNEKKGAKLKKNIKN